MKASLKIIKEKETEFLNMQWEGLKTLPIPVKPAIFWESFPKKPNAIRPSKHSFRESQPVRVWENLTQESQPNHKFLGNSGYTP